MNQALFSHQCFAEALLLWLQKLGTYSKCLSSLTCQLLFTSITNVNDTTESSPFILKLLAHNLHAWQQIRENMHLLVVNTVLMNPYWKKQFAMLYATNYRSFVHAHLTNRNFTTLTTLNLTVQIFPVSSLTSMFMEEADLLTVIVNTLIEIANIENEGMTFLTGSSEKTPEYVLSKLILIDLRLVFN